MAHEYKRTHTWLTFHLDLGRASQQLLLLLGECRSKCEHIAGVPLNPEVAEKLHSLYLAKGIHATTAIEGNTLTLEQVKKAVSGRLELPPSQEYLVREIDNIVDACNELAPTMREGCLEITTQLIEDLNRKVLGGLPVLEHVSPGQIRHYSVGVGRYRGAPHSECRYLLDLLCQWLQNLPTNIWGPGSEIPTAIVKAVLAHVYIAWIHPFGDGNGRTARLLEFCILTNAGVPSPAAHLLSNHYNLTRSKYYQELDQSSQTGGDLFPFMRYAVEGLRDGLSQQIQEVRKAHWEVAWTDYIYSFFRGHQGPAPERRKELVLALSVPFDEKRVVRPRDIAKLTPELEQMYAGKTSKTVTRDINELVDAGLVVREEHGIRARVEQILAFLPPRKPVDDIVQKQVEQFSRPEQLGLSEQQLNLL